MACFEMCGFFCCCCWWFLKKNIHWFKLGMRTLKIAYQQKDSLIPQTLLSGVRLKSKK